MPSFRLKRGNSEKVSSYVGNAGELIYNTETNKVVVMDGVNAGGVALGGSEVVDVNTPPAFQPVLHASALTEFAEGNKLEANWITSIDIQENQDTIYWVSSRNALVNARSNAIYSVSKNDFNGWLGSATSSLGFATPPISSLPSYKVISGLDWWTWMDNNGGRPTNTDKKYPYIFIDKQSTGANPVAYLVFLNETRISNSTKYGRTFIATGSNLENLQELLMPTINNQFPGSPALVDANAGGAFDQDQTAPTDTGYADMDANFWSSTTQPALVMANATHIFVMVQYWGVNVYLKDGTYVKSLKHPVLGWYNSGWDHAYLKIASDSGQDRGAMFCTDDRLVIVSGDYYKGRQYYQDLDATYRDAAQGTLEAAQFDMFWGEIAVYTGDGTYINTFKNPMPRQNGEYNTFAYEGQKSINLLSNNILTLYNTDSQLIENGLGATNGIADGTVVFEEGAIHIYDLNTMTKINTVYNTDPDIVGWTWSFAYLHHQGPKAIPDGTNDCILIIASDDNKYIWRAVRGSTGEILDTYQNVAYNEEGENDLWGFGYTVTNGAAAIDFGGAIIQLDDGTVVLSGTNFAKPPQATVFKIAGEITSKLKLGDNKFLKLPNDSSYELDITKTKLSDFTNDVGFALGSQIPTVPTTLSSFTNDAGFAVGTIPTALSELTNDSSYATTSQIPTALSALTNDAGFATTAQIPTALSELTNDSGFATTAQIPTNLSELTNDADFATTAQLPSVPTALSQLTNDTGFPTGTIPTALSELTNDAGFATTSQIPTALSELTNDAGFATTAQLPSVPTALSELTNDAGLITAAEVPAVSVVEFAEWSDQNGIIDPANITLPSKAKKIHRVTITPTSDFTLNLTAEAGIVNGTVLQTSYTNILNEVTGISGNSTNVTFLNPVIGMHYMDSVPDNPLMFFEAQSPTSSSPYGEGTWKIVSVMTGFANEYLLNEMVNFDPAGTIPENALLGTVDGYQIRYANTAGSVSTNASPYYPNFYWRIGSASSYETFLDYSKLRGTHVRSVGYSVYTSTSDQVWEVTTSFNDYLAVGESTKAIVMVDLGAAAYKASDFKIDGVSQNVKWLGGTVPQGTANAQDVYTYEIFKTADSTYTVLGSYASYS
jgi:hypothetical protein